MKNVQRTLALAIGCGVTCFACRAFGVGTAWAVIMAAILCISVFVYIFFSFGKEIKKSAVAVILAAAFCVLGVLTGGALLSKRMANEALVSDETHLIKAVVDEISYTADYSSEVVATITEIDGKSAKVKVRVSFPFDPLLYKNDVFSASGSFEEIDSYAYFYESEGVFVAFSADECEYIESKKDGLFDKIEALSDKLSEKVASLIGGKEGKVASAIALGDKSGLTSRLKLDFRRVGASHILAVSGMHLSVLILFLRIIFGFVNKKKRNLILIAIALFYMALTGFSPSVCRAALMIAVFLAAEIFGEEGDGITSLFVAMAVILAVSPNTVYAAGFWLSCLATFGILTVVPAFKFKFLAVKDGNGRVKRFFKRVLKYILTLAVASVAAQMFTLPVIFVTFGGISVFSVISGIILIPIAEIALILSIFACVFAFVPFVSVAVAAVAKLPLSLMVFTVEKISSVSGAYISIRQPFSKYIIAAGIILTAVVIAVKRLDKRYILAVGAAQAAVFCVCLCIFGAMKSGVSDVIYSVRGQNESITVYTRGNVFVFDMSNGGYSALGEAVNNVNDIYCEEIDYAVLTHLHINHITSVKKLVSSIKVENLLLPTAENENDAYIIRSIRTVVGDSVNIMFYNRASESEIAVDGLKIELPTNVSLKRSTHPLIAFCIEENGHRVTYLGASCADTGDEHVNKIYLNSDCLMIGVHGPKVGEKFNIRYSAAKTAVFGGDIETHASIDGYEGEVILAEELGGTVKIRFENK